MYAVVAASAGRAPREESRGGLEDLVGPAELLVLAFQLGDAALVRGGQSATTTLVDLGLADPTAQRLGPDAELAGDAGDGAVTHLPLFDGPEDQPDRSLTKLCRVAVLGALGV